MSKTKLLIVEDDAHLLLGLRDILELDEYEVLTAENGKEALKILNKLDTPPDLIVSDIMMPEMDGIEFLTQVREKDEWVTIPFIFLTAKGEKTDIYQGKFLGVDEYLVKPFDADELLMAVEAKLKRHRAINQAQVGMVSDLKRSILTILNHEFRTPLTLVVAYADMLKDFEIEEMTHEQLLEFLKGVNSGAERLRRLIENFILLVELESGDTAKTYEWRQHLLKDPTSIFYAARDAVTSDTSKHEIEIEIDGKIPPFTGDSEFLVIAIRELLHNAIKFSPEDSIITLGAHVENNQLHILVQDRGRGIMQDEIERIWQVFYQVERERHEDQGAGAGLAIAKGIIDLHQGEILVTSDKKSGTCFKIILPLVRQQNGVKNT